MTRDLTDINGDQYRINRYCQNRTRRCHAKLGVAFLVGMFLFPLLAILGV